MSNYAITLNKNQRYFIYKLDENGDKIPTNDPLNGRGGGRSSKLYEVVFYNADQIKNFSLETDSVLPSVQGHKTIIENYILHFHCPLLKGAGYTLIQLLSMAYGSNDIILDIDLLAERVCKERRSVMKDLQILEKAGWVLIFYAEDENGASKGVGIKIRKTVPLLTIKQIESLPEKTRKYHDKFIMQLLETKQLFFENEDNKYPREKLENTGTKLGHVSKITDNFLDYAEFLQIKNESENEFVEGMQKMQGGDAKFATPPCKNCNPGDAKFATPPCKNCNPGDAKITTPGLQKMQPYNYLYINTNNINTNNINTNNNYFVDNFNSCKETLSKKDSGNYPLKNCQDEHNKIINLWTNFFEDPNTPASLRSFMSDCELKLQDNQLTIIFKNSWSYSWVMDRHIKVIRDYWVQRGYTIILETKVNHPRI